MDKGGGETREKPKQGTNHRDDREKGIGSTAGETPTEKGTDDMDMTEETQEAVEKTSVRTSNGERQVPKWQRLDKRRATKIRLDNGKPWKATGQPTTSAMEERGDGPHGAALRNHTLRK